MHMPLSEHEKRLLAQMEEALAVDDPRLVNALTGSARVSRNRVLGAIALVITGIATLFAGLTFFSEISAQMMIGLGGFLLALTGSVILFRAFTTPGALMSAPSGGKPKAPRPNKGLGDRLQERWDQRNFEE
jgi:hypothetical protein